LKTGDNVVTQNDTLKHYKKLMKKNPKKLTFEEKKFLKIYKSLKKG